MSFAQHIRAVLVLGLPLIASHLAQYSIQVVDTVMLGWYSVTALAASVLAGSFFFVLFIVGAGFAFAVMPMVAEAAERGEEVRIRRVTRMGMWLSVLFAIACLPIMIWSGPLLQMLGQSPELSGLAQEYLRIAGLGLIPALLVMVLKSYLVAMERTQVVLWLTIAGVAINGLLNWAFIFGNFGAPEMGLRGAALASLMAHFITFTAMALYASHAAGLREHTLFKRVWRSDGQAMTEVFRLGWPIGLTYLAESGLFSASALIIGLIGTLALAAHGIALQIVSVVFMVHIGLSQAMTVRAGRALGRGDVPAVGRGGMAGTLLSGLVVLVTVGVFLTMPEPLVSAFLAPDDPNRVAILAIGAGLLTVACLFQAVDAGQVVALGLLRGIQDTRVPMYLAAISYWGLGFPASYLLAITWGFGAAGVWVGLVVGLMAACVSLWWRFGVLYRRMRALDVP